MRVAPEYRFWRLANQNADHKLKVDLNTDELVIDHVILSRQKGLLVKHYFSCILSNLDKRDNQSIFTESLANEDEMKHGLQVVHETNLQHQYKKI